MDKGSKKVREKEGEGGREEEGGGTEGKRKDRVGVEVTKSQLHINEPFSVIKLSHSPLDYCHSDLLVPYLLHCSH